MKQEVVLITGGSSGIGKAIGIYLSTRGYTVYGTARNPAKYPGFDAFELLELDVQDTTSIQKAIATLLRKEERIDILINNAGVGITGPIEETPHDEVLNAFATNFHGPLHMIKAVLPQMRKQGRGHILNITSIAGYMGLPYRGIYSASKGALNLVSEALRMEIKEFGIKLSTVAPGDVATNIAAGRYHAPIQNDSPYKTSYEQNLNAIDADVDAGEDPMKVAAKVHRVLVANSPKVHYPVGSFLQKFSITLKKILPDKLYEKLLLNHYKL